jgi:hypothetical protein
VTEAEWLTCADPHTIWEFLQIPACDRRARLFVCACCRRIWDVFTDNLYRQAVEVVERYVDGLATERELNAAHAAVSTATSDSVALVQESFAPDPSAWERAGLYNESRPANPVRFARDTVMMAASWVDPVSGGSDAAAAEALLRANPLRPGKAKAFRMTFSAARSAQADLARDIYGNPFRPVSLDPTWRTSIVTALATPAYEERHLPAGTLDTQRLAILADALEDAGCTDEQILGHLRGPGPHVRGCWVVDLLLGKE